MLCRPTLLPAPVAPATSRCGMVVEVGVIGLAVDVGAQRHGEHRRGFAEAVVGEQRAQTDDAAFLVGHLDAQGRAPGHAVDAHRLGLERQGKVVLQVDDLADLDARGRLELEHRDDRAGADGLDRSFDAELGAAAADGLAEPHQLRLVHGPAAVSHLQQVHRRHRAWSDAGGERQLLLRHRPRSGGNRSAGARQARQRRRHCREVLVLRRAGGAHPADGEVGLPAPLGDPRRAQRQVDAVRRRRSHRDRRRGQRRAVRLDGGLLLLLLLGHALQVLGDDPPPAALLLPPFAPPLAGQDPLLPEMPQAVPPGREKIAEGRLHQQGRAADRRRDKHHQRPGEIEAGLEEFLQQQAESAARRDRTVRPVDAAQADLQQGRRRRQQQRRAEPAPYDPARTPPPQTPPPAYQQEQGDQQTRQPEKAVRRRRDVSADRADPIPGVGVVGGNPVQQTRILGMMAAQGENQEHAGREQQQAEELVPLLRRKGGPIGSLALLADDGDGHGASRIRVNN